MLMEVKRHIRVSLLSIKYNIMREMTNTISFCLNVIFMAMNNATFIIQWVILFSLKDSFGGFGFKEVMLLWGVSATSFGIAHVMFNGVFIMPKLIENGKLDQFLVMPKNTLIMVATSNTSVSALGDLLYGIVVFIIFWHEPYQIILFIILSILGAIIYVSLMTIFNSFTFWFIRSSDFAESIRHMFINFSLYPEGIFKRAIKILFYTLIPVGFAVYLPANMIINFNIINLLYVSIFTIFITTIAFFTFYKGLKRYTSSNLMVSRI